MSTQLTIGGVRTFGEKARPSGSSISAPSRDSEAAPGWDTRDHARAPRAEASPTPPPDDSISSTEGGITLVPPEDGGESPTPGFTENLRVVEWVTETVRIYAVEAATGTTTEDYYIDVERVTKVVWQDSSGRKYSPSFPW